MTTPATLPDTPDAATGPTVFLSNMFTSLSMSAGINKMVHDIAQAWAKLGTGSSTAAANTVLRGTGAGVTAFGQAQTGDLAAHAITDVESTYAAGLITTTSTSYVDMTSMSLSWTSTVVEDLIVDFSAALGNTVVGRAINVAFSLDGAAESFAMDVTASVASGQIPTPGQAAYEAVAAGAHTVKVRWLTGGDTARAQSRAFRVLRVKK